MDEAKIKELDGLKSLKFKLDAILKDLNNVINTLNIEKVKNIKGAMVKLDKEKLANDRSIQDQFQKYFEKKTEGMELNGRGLKHIPEMFEYLNSKLTPLLQTKEEIDKLRSAISKFSKQLSVLKKDNPQRHLVTDKLSKLRQQLRREEEKQLGLKQKLSTPKKNLITISNTIKETRPPWR